MVSTMNGWGTRATQASPPLIHFHPRPYSDCEPGWTMLARGVAIVESRDGCRCVVPWVCAPAGPVLRGVAGGLRHCGPVFVHCFEREMYRYFPFQEKIV